MKPLAEEEARPSVALRIVSYVSGGRFPGRFTISSGFGLLFCFQNILSEITIGAKKSGKLADGRICANRMSAAPLILVLVLVLVAGGAAAVLYWMWGKQS